MASISADFSQVVELAADIERIPANAGREIRATVKKTALEIKRRMQTDMRASAHFRAVAPSISFDLRDGGLEAEIGPVKGSPGSLANIAYFGSSRAGGGTVTDPVEALRAEAETAIPFLEKAIMEAING